MKKINDFLYGFFFCFFIFTMTLMFKEANSTTTTQSQFDYTDPSRIKQDIESLFKDKQNKNIVLLAKSTPSLTDFGQGDVVFSTVSSRGFTRYANDRYYFTITKF